MSNKSGFTLIELILVVVILGILAGAVVPVFQGRSEQARIGRAKTDIATYGTQVDLYALDHNDKYPDSLNDLVSGKKKYVQQVMKDPWNNDYIYKNNGSSYEISSAGPDGSPGNADDVTTSSVHDE
jgi:general secretion pathway protein G